MKLRKAFPVFFTITMLVVVLFLVWYVPAVSQRSFQLRDIEKSLETSQGRERKQQYEYDKVVAEIPEIQAELDLIRPRADAADQEVADLKSRRKKLRNEKKELERKLEEASAQEGSANGQ